MNIRKNTYVPKLTLLTLDQAATEFNISRRTLDRGLRDGSIDVPVKKIRGQKRILLSDIIAYLERQNKGGQNTDDKNCRNIDQTNPATFSQPSLPFGSS